MAPTLSTPPGPADPHVWQVVVIGAGQAGLATAHDLARRGLVPGEDFLVLDDGAGPGGAWRERWDSLTLGRAHGIADLPGLPLGPVDPTLPASRVVADYHGRYEEMFHLAVRRPVRVVAVRSTDLPAPALTTAPGSPPAGAVPVSAPPAGSAPPGPPPADPLPTPADHPSRALLPRDTLLACVVEDRRDPDPVRRTLLTRMVVSAAGTWSRPFVPWVPGAPQFRGRQLHTVDYTRAEDFSGARVVVVGGGLSAVQFLLELEPVAHTVWATRRPPNFTDVTFDHVWGTEVEETVDRRTAAGLPPASVVRTTGIPRQPAYLAGITRGTLVSRGMFDRIGAHGVRFSPAATSADPAGLGPAARERDRGLVEPDSWRPYAAPTWVDADVVFWNTGFRPALGPLAPLRLREPGERGIVMDGRVTVAADPRVLLVGYGSSASTLGATRAGREAARVALSRLTGGPRNGVGP